MGSTAYADTAPTTASIVIDANAQVNGYTTTTVTMAGGGTLSVVNNDDIQHTVSSIAVDGDGKRLFDTLAKPGTTTVVPEASTLAAGTYDFECRFHQLSMRGTLTIAGDGGTVHAEKPTFDQPLLRPKVLTDAHIRIPVERADVRVLPTGPRTRMWTFGGSYPGPTIIRPAGHDTKVTFINRLPRRAGALTVHFHGDHHASASDGQPDSHLIRHGHSRTYDYPLTDHGRPERAASLFYHDHRMGLTGRNIWNGLQGMFLIKDGKAADLRLPRGRFDVPLLVSDRSFTSDNQLTQPFPDHPVMELTGPQAPPDDATVGTRILANGRFAPYLKVSTHRYRLRIVNGSNFTSYNFALSNGRAFTQVGTGNGLLPKPVRRTHILLGPAQRTDVVVGFHGELGKRVILESTPRTDAAPAGAVGTPTAAIMQFRVVRASAHDRTRVPSRLQPAPKIDVPSKVSKTWTFDVAGHKKTGSVWTVNGKPYDPSRVDATVPLGSTQLWKLHNASPITHYIHLHEEQWHTVSRDGGPPLPWERGLEDTWKLDPGETVTVAARFTDHTGVFMLHCHMLDHEDHGLMAQFEVVEPSASASRQASVLLPSRRTTPVGNPVTRRQTTLATALARGLGRLTGSLPMTAAFMCGPRWDA